MAIATLKENLLWVREEIARVQAACGVSQEVTVVAVTKGHPAQAVEAAHEAGLLDVGENRVQEAVEKRSATRTVPVRWHLIGHLQTNKAKLVPGAFAMVHSVDSWHLAEALAGAVLKAAARSVGSGAVEPLPVLLQVNVAGEAQKSGCSPEATPDLAHHIARTPGLALQGLMTMAPLTDDERVQHRVFESLRQLRDATARPDLPLKELSMGMSGDFRAAVAEGATMLRLGTILFGERAS